MHITAVQHILYTIITASEFNCVCFILFFIVFASLDIYANNVDPIITDVNKFHISGFTSYVIFSLLKYPVFYPIYPIL